jgi:hypothetical protein
MRRWLLWLPLSILTVLIVLAGAILLARAEIAEAAARYLLDRRGFPDAELTVATLTADRLELTDVDLGPGAPRAARIAVVYTPRGLLDGHVQRVEVDGPSVVVDLAAKQPIGGVLDALPAGPSAQAGPARVPRLPDGLPTVLLRNAAVEIRDARASAQLSLSGRLLRQDGETRATLRGQMRTPHTTADISLDGRRLGRDPRLFLDVTGRSQLAGLPWPRGQAVRPAAGRAQFALSGELQFPSPGQALTWENLIQPSSRLSVDLGVSHARLSDLADGLRGQARLNLAVADGSLVVRLNEPLRLEADRLDRARLTALGLPPEAVDLAERFRSLAITPWTGGHELIELHAFDQHPAAPSAIGWRWNGRASLQASGAADAPGGPAAARPHLQLRAAADGTLSRGFGLQVARVGMLDVQARNLAYGPHRLAAAAFAGTATMKPGGLSLDGTVTADGLSVSAAARRVDGIALEAPLALRHTDAGTRLTLSAPASVRVPDLPDTRPVVVDAPVDLAITDLEVTAVDGQVQGGLKIDPGTLQARLLRRDAANLDASLTPGPIEVALDGLRPLQARVGFDEGQLRIPGEKIGADQVSAKFKHGFGNPVALISLGHLVHEAESALFAPSLLWMNLYATGEQGWRVVGQQIIKGTGFQLDFAARTGADGRTGEAWLGPVAATFRPGELQPGQLSQALGRWVSNAEGEIGLRGQLDWSPQGVDGWADLLVTGLSFDGPVARVEKLSGAVFLDSLTPADTGPDQRLTAQSVTAGVPLQDVEIVFDVDAENGRTRVRIPRADGKLADGQVFLRDVTLRPFSETSRLTVQVRGVSMSRLVELLEVEGLRADGTIAGEIPLLLGPQGVRIDDGELGAVDQGRIQVEFGAARDPLVSQGESVSLMVRALQDFRYDTLTLRLTRPDTGDLALAITMQGKNPDVLDGYPFRFNVDVSGDLEPILSALQEGRKLTTDLLQRALENRGAESLQVQ